ncbi:GON-4-like protein isoform X2 [Diachasma alloeum]|uniref:GON-4-like protein isoform X2 n=1 Tax=Diachasma alloeum TaxID=454923 RepID=UPI0007383A21|nr:GON-4-like protein isoform X2 [Diachasma alloeum]
MEVDDATRVPEALSTPSPSSSPRKCNLSFSFNFDVDGIDSESTTDSETPGLQIDVSEVINYQKTRKRKYIEIEETSAIDEMEEEIERQLDAKAAKTNLTATNVKNILKHVITNEHVLAMVQNSVHNTEEGAIFEPKLTRAKAKELAMAQPNIPWPMTPVKKPRSSEVQALISEDFHEDSSDEEYNPDHDQQSEDEGDHLTNSDVDSSPATPVTQVESQIPPDGSTGDQLPRVDVHYDEEGVFKIPSIPHVPTEEESIGQRTRSKLSLSETPLEHIEQAFIPPDITTDMYDWDYDMDEEWNKFLTEFTQPLQPNGEDDPEADPEYNILEDRESEMLDKEEIRDDKAVKVSRKELKDLVAELFEFEDMFAKGEIQEGQEGGRKRKSLEASVGSVHNNSTDNPMVNLLPALAEPELPKIVSFEHSNLIAIQFQQHVQLMVQHFVMTYQHPELHSQSITCKDNLNSINFLRTGDHSAFNVLNLPDALVLANDWEEKFKDEKFRAEYSDMQANEIKVAHMKASKKLGYTPKFHPEMIKLFMESRALMYPELLPHVPMKNPLRKGIKAPYSRSEEYLLALGLEQFIPFHEGRERKFSFKKMILMDAAKSISEFLMPARSPKALYGHVELLRAAADDNPVGYYFKNGYVPSRIHCIALDNTARAPKEQPKASLPVVWQEISSEENLAASTTTCSTPLIRSLSESTDNIVIDASFLSPLINMLPNMPNLDQTPPKRNSNPLEEDSAPQEHPLQPPQLRQTTPRLAKIRSAQNMKLMTQVSGPKSSPSPSPKSRSKDESPKTPEVSESSRGDNEDEIAELMLASTTIRKDSVNRKKAKEARELENIKRLMEAETDLGHEERVTKFAASCIQKVHVTLEASNPELLRTIVKLFTDYSEKIEGAKQRPQDLQDKVAVDFYRGVCNALKDYPELASDFVSFLKPHQAVIVDQFKEHTMSKKMAEFMNVAQVYFAKQPARMTRLMQAITQLAAEPSPSLEGVHAVMDPVLKGHSLPMDMFLQCIPSGRPPESLFLPHLFENLTCPVGPYDKNKVYSEDSPELYENVELSTPPSQDDYGGENCRCICHENNNSPSKTNSSEHCISCGVRYLNGRIYLQTSEGLRPAKVTFPGDEEEKLENIARVSLKTSERCSPAGSTGRRRKSSKNEAGPDEVSQKFSLKGSPVKEGEEGKTRRGGKSPPKYVDQRRMSKSSDTGGSSVLGQSSDSSPIKSKREKRAERREAKSDSKNCNLEFNKGVEGRFGSSNDQDETTSKVEATEVSEESSKVDNSEDEVNVSEQMEVENSKSDSDVTVEPEDVDRPWSRHEDAVLLQHVQRDYSERTFEVVSEVLEGRTVQQVKRRCEILLSLLEKIV